MGTVLIMAIGLLGQQAAGPVPFEALPDYPCAQAGTDGVHFETSAVEWSWAPSGEAVTYDRAVGSVSQLRAHRLSDGAVRCLTDGAEYDSQPSWSPDDRRIAFVRGRGAEARLRLLDLADGSVAELGIADGRAEYPRFSPDGRRLAYVRFDEADPGRRWVIVRDLREGTELPVFESPFGLNNLSWTPDGSAVVLYSIDEDGWNDVYEARADASGVRRLTDNTVTDSYSADYAPAGDRLVYGQGAEVSPFHRWFNYDLYERDLDAGTVRRLTWAHQADDRAYWAPDGRALGFVSRRTGYAELYLMEPDGTALRQVTHQPEGELTSLIRREGVEAGEAHLRRARAADPGARPMGDRAASVLTHQLLARGALRDAVRVARLGIEIHPASWWAQTALGRALLASGDDEGARRAFRRSLALNANQYQIAYDLGHVAFRRALDSIEGVYRDQGAAVLTLTQVLHARGELLSAMTLLGRLEEEHPDDADVLAARARMRMALGDHERAAADYRRVLGLAPDRQDARFHLTRIEGLAAGGPPGVS